MTNRLAGVTSPYLQQHAGNPVDWYPWGEEALALARAEIRPILLSIGYSACHRCHVMAHESFEDESVASATNALFVCAGSRFPGQWAPPILTCVVDAGMRDLFPSAPAWRERRSKAGLSPRKGDR